MKGTTINLGNIPSLSDKDVLFMHGVGKAGLGMWRKDTKTYAECVRVVEALEQEIKKRKLEARA